MVLTGRHRVRHQLKGIAMNESETLLRLPEVLRRYPVSRSTWYEGVKRGRYPAPVKLSARISAWRKSDIDEIVANARKAAAPAC